MGQDSAANEKHRQYLTIGDKKKQKQNKNKSKNKNKPQKTLFYGRTDLQVGLVSRTFFIFYVFLAAKMTLKAQKFQEKKNLTFFKEKFWENILTYFQKFSAKNFRFWSKYGWFYKILEKMKETKQNKNNK